MDRPLNMLLKSDGRSYIVMKATEKSRGTYVYVNLLVNAFLADVDPYNPLKSMSNSSLPHTF
jgi:hypothetical protein